MFATGRNPARSNRAFKKSGKATILDESPDPKSSTSKRTRETSPSGLTPPSKSPAMGNPGETIVNNRGDNVNLDEMDTNTETDLRMLDALKRRFGPNSDLGRMLENNGNVPNPPNWDLTALTKRAALGEAVDGADLDLDHGIAIGNIKKKLDNTINDLPPAVAPVVEELFNLCVAIYDSCNKKLGLVLEKLNDDAKCAEDARAEALDSSKCFELCNKFMNDFNAAEYKLTITDVPVDVDDTGNIKKESAKAGVIKKIPGFENRLHSGVDVIPLRKTIKDSNVKTAPVMIIANGEAQRREYLGVLRASGVRNGRHYSKETYDILKKIRSQLNEKFPNQQFMIRPSFDGMKMVIKTRIDENHDWKKLETGHFPVPPELIESNGIKKNPLYVWKNFSLAKK